MGIHTSIVPTKKLHETDDHIFNGNIYLLHAFDIGEDVDLQKIKAIQHIITSTRTWPKHFKHFHTPLSVELMPPQDTQMHKCFRANIHHFGVVSLTYKIPFKGTLDALQSKINVLNTRYQNQSLHDAEKLFHKIKPCITQPKSFHHRTSYVIAHIDPQQELITGEQLIEKQGPLIASALRFEKETISEYQMDEILSSTTGYYEQDLVVIDTESAFIYDHEAEELLDFFEQTLVQQLELQYFDKLLDRKLDDVYNQTIQKKSFLNYLPFVGTVYDPLSELSKLKVDVSVITERLDSSIKLIGEPYFTKIYNLLVEKLEINSWRQSVEKKLSIIHDVRSIYQNKVNAIREDLLTSLIIILIMIELVVAVTK